MPALTAFGRHWGIGSDDLVCFGFFSLIARIIWLIFFCIICHFHAKSFHCPSGRIIQIFLLTFIALLVVLIIIDAATWIVSSRGTMTNVKPRRSIPTLLYLRLALMIPEVALNILGTYWAFADSTHCPNEDIVIVKIAVIVNWCLFALFIITAHCIFDPLGSVKQDGNRDPAITYELAQQVWERRCRHLCCQANVNDTRHQAVYTELATTFATFFRNTNTVPTDVAAGLVLLQRKQQYNDKYLVQWKKNEAVPVESPQKWQPRPINLKTKEGYSVVQDLYHYGAYADAAYGWPLCVFENFMTAPCKLVPLYRCCSCWRKKRPSGTTIIADNCCECHYAALKLQSGLADDDIIMASYNNDLYQLPFFIAFDRSRKNVVIAIRGTMSVNDAITDLLALPGELEIEGYQRTYGHKGMYESAKVLNERLIKDGILDSVFRDYPDYGLVVLGHSLGAGVATILSVLMRPKYPDLKCYAFSPPGGLVSIELAKYTRDFVISAVAGHDLVSRISLQNMEDLRNKITWEIRSSEIAKYKILLTGCCIPACCTCCCDSVPLDDEIINLSGDKKNSSGVNGNDDEDEDDGNLIDSKKEEKKSILKDTTDIDGDESFSGDWSTRTLTSTKLYLPGRIVHILKNDDESSKRAKFKAYWNEPEYYSVIRVESTMISDHMIAPMMKGFKDILQEAQINEQELK